ncbi:DUF4240 domain-containing protein [Dactylosporangium sp. NPDC051484]|uniref:DUF4240 domain-containing protein n=1 Tax=Dactylosporangium sp. NPDC051484 TaxID=3154942 RepID=UPI00344C52AE
MDVDQFWAVVDGARAQAGGDWSAVPEFVTDALARRPLADIADFAQIQDELEWAAYREDLLTACRLINAGFGSDDGFLYFRDWLLVQGRAAFEAALANPDSLLDVPGVSAMDPVADDCFADCEDFLYVANEAWRRVTGAPELSSSVDKRGHVSLDPDEVDGLEEELERRGYEARRDEPLPLAGEPIAFKDRDAVFAALPRLSARFYDQVRGSRRRLMREP